MEDFKKWFKSLNGGSLMILFILLALPIFIVPETMIIPAIVGVLLSWGGLFWMNRYW